MRDWPAGIRWTVIPEKTDADAGAAGGVLTATAASGVAGAWVKKIAPKMVSAANDHASRKGQRRPITWVAAAPITIEAGIWAEERLGALPLEELKRLALSFKGPLDYAAVLDELRS
jgi:hypothetical protein